MYKKTKTYEEIRNFVTDLPVIDCRERTKGPTFAPPYKEPISSLILGYFRSDLLSVGITEDQLIMLQNQDIATEEKWSVFKKYW